MRYLTRETQCRVTKGHLHHLSQAATRAAYLDPSGEDLKKCYYGYRHAPLIFILGVTTGIAAGVNTAIVVLQYPGIAVSNELQQGISHGLVLQ